MIKITDTVRHLIIINVLFFVGTLAFKEKAYDLLAMHYIESPFFKPWQLITHIFMHGSAQHILFNMIGLWMFGSSVEQIIGTKKFLILYFIAGIGAVLFSQGIDYFQFHQIYNKLLIAEMPVEQIQQLITKTLPYGKGYVNQDYQSIYSIYHSSLVGASGALYGVMVAFGVLMPRAKMGLMLLPIMIEARIFIPLLILSDVYFGILGGTNIGHFAHVGGAIFGFLVIWYYRQQYMKNRHF